MRKLIFIFMICSLNVCADTTLEHCNKVVDSYVQRFLVYQGFWYCRGCGKGNVGLSSYCSKCNMPRH